ncbi:cohesin subunit SA-2-like [Pelobates fuscus]|uniref:cohesin subunit SA-2-like n=1 Tax=Pelobates fuscus TaxID=191477 RepID=UPI002FE4AACF
MIAESNQDEICQKENSHTNGIPEATKQNGGIFMTPKAKRIRKPSETHSRRSSARRSRDSRITNGDVTEAVTLFEVVSIGKRAIQSVVDDWIEAYQEDRDVALLDLINFYIQCSGCQGVVTAELFQNPDNREIIKKLTEEFDEETGLQFKKFMAYPWILTVTWPANMDTEDYPLIKPGTYWKKFKANFCEFTSLLVQQCQYSVIYDGYLLDTIISLLLGLADSCVRAFRHTSTLSAMKLLTALIRVVLNLDISIDNAQRLFKVEKKRAAFKRTNSRLEQLDKKRKELLQKHQEMENLMEVLFKGTFVHRYRDVVSEIRALCIDELGIWMRMYPKTYLNDSCLKYIGWMLYDKVPEVRLKCLVALQGLYDNKDHVSKMDLFTTRFKDRIVSMTLDRDHDVCVQAMKLLVYISQNCEDVLTSEDCESLYQFVYAAHRPLAAAAGEFLYKRHLNQLAREQISLHRKEEIEHNAIQLRALLTFFSNSELHQHLTYLVDSLWDCTTGFLKDWHCMSTILLQKGNNQQTALNESQKSLLIELILASVRQAVEGHPPVGRGSAKKVLSTKEKRVQMEDSVRITEHFAGTLPLLLVKFVPDPDKVTNLLQLPQYFDMDVYSAGSMDKHLEALLKQIQAIVEYHSAPEVLEACSKAYRSLSKENLESHVQVNLSKTQLVEQLVGTFSQKLEDILQEGAEHCTAEDVLSLSHVLRRLAAFHNAHNLTQWDLYQKTAQLLSFDIDQSCLPVQLILPAIQCCYYALLWKVLPVMEDSCPKEVLVSLKTQVTHFCQFCRHYLNHQDQSLREQAFMSLCDLLLFLRQRGGGVSSYADSTMQLELLSFVQKHVFQIDEKNTKLRTEKDDELILSCLHRRRSLLAVYCKLIAFNAVEMSAASEIYKQYMKTYNDFGDIIKETLSRTRQNNRIESAKTLVLCLQQLYQKHRELYGSTTQNSLSFTNIKELARRFSLTFGMDHVKCRESVAMMHKQGIEFAFREPAVEEGQPPPNLPFLILISEFSSKLLKADKRLVSGYLQRFANEQMLLYRGAEWHPLVVYNNSLQDTLDEDSSFNGSSVSQDIASSSISPYLKRKPSHGVGLEEEYSSEHTNSHRPVKSRKRLIFEEQSSRDSISLQSVQPPKKQQNIEDDEDIVEVDMEIDKEQENVVTMIMPSNST